VRDWELGTTVPCILRASSTHPCGECSHHGTYSLGKERTLSEGHIAQSLGMTEDELYRYLDELLHEEAAEAAEQTGRSVEEELESAGFQAVGAAATYAIKLIDANNAFITRQLLDAGVLMPESEG